MIKRASSLKHTIMIGINNKMESYARCKKKRSIDRLHKQFHCQWGLMYWNGGEIKLNVCSFCSWFTRTNIANIYITVMQWRPNRTVSRLYFVFSQGLFFSCLLIFFFWQNISVKFKWREAFSWYSPLDLNKWKNSYKGSPIWIFPNLKLEQFRRNQSLFICSYW